MSVMKDFFDDFDNIQMDELAAEEEISIDELACRIGYLVKDEYSIAEIAHLLDCDPTLVEDAISTGQLKCSVAQIVVAKVEDINDWIAER